VREARKPPSASAGKVLRVDRTSPSQIDKAPALLWAHGREVFTSLQTLIGSCLVDAAGAVSGWFRTGAAGGARIVNSAGAVGTAETTRAHDVSVVDYNRDGRQDSCSTAVLFLPFGSIAVSRSLRGQHVPASGWHPGARRRTRSRWNLGSNDWGRLGCRRGLNASLATTTRGPPHLSNPTIRKFTAMPMAARDPYA
jgi:hypothetical protein